MPLGADGSTDGGPNGDLRLALACGVLCVCVLMIAVTTVDCTVICSAEI